MELIVERDAVPSPANAAFEIVERKGLGHPDTICDAVAESFSRQLSRFYLERFGTILHHNVDKALLIGGVARPAFGGGTVSEPIELILAGRATREFRGVSVPVDDIARACVRDWFTTRMHAFDVERHLRIRTAIRPGSPDLVALFARQQDVGKPLANDTSCGVGFAPRTPLEAVVGTVEDHLNAPARKRSHPEIGEDIKVMGLRSGDRMRLTIACALVDRYVADAADYAAKTRRVAALASESAWAAGGAVPDIVVNAADDNSGGSVYITVTGTSAESGDDGEVGRGNRANGLITPLRPMTMEAAAGKNPMSHVGKLYNVAARRAAEAIVATVPGAAGATCWLVSRIGRPVDDPELAVLRLNPAPGASVAALQQPAAEILRAEIARIPGLWREIIDGVVALF
jgi:S-adenosylmethionine synthetase